VRWVSHRACPVSAGKGSYEQETTSAREDPMDTSGSGTFIDANISTHEPI
jgi:hypothetical protein